MTARVELVARCVDPEEGAPRQWFARESWTAVGPVEAGPDGTFALEGVETGHYVLVARTRDGGRGESAVSLYAPNEKVQADVFVQPRPETLEGRALGPGARPWTGNLTVQAAGDRVPEAVTIDALGRFRCALPPGTAVVCATDADRLRVTLTQVEVPRERTLLVYVADDVAATMRVLEDDDGSPVSGAEVVTRAWGPGFERTCRTITGANGEFPWPRAEDGWVLVSARGFASRSVALREGVAPRDVRLARGAALSGRVTRADDGSGVANVRVEARPIDERYRVRGSARTDAEGRYEIADLPAGAFVVVATSEEWETRGFADADIDAGAGLMVRTGPGERATKDVRVVATAVFAGVVLRPDGRPVTDAVVGAGTGPSPFAGSGGGWSSAWRDFRGPTVAEYPKKGRSRPDGSFRVRAPAGERWYVFAGAPGAPWVGMGPYLPGTGQPERLEIRLPRSESVPLRVVDAQTGAPMAGVSVSASCDAKEGEREITDRWSGTTAADGRARIDSAFSGCRVRLSARAPGYVDVDREEVDNAGGSVELRLDRGRRVSGRVLYEYGVPAAGATVGLRRKGFYGMPRSGTECRAGADGRFDCREAPVGPIEVWSHASRLGDSAWRSVNLAADAAEVTLVLRRSASGSEGPSDEVLVTDADGRPVPRAFVARVLGPARPRNVGERGWAVTWWHGPIRSTRYAVLDGLGEVPAVTHENLPRTVYAWGATTDAGSPLPLGVGRAEGDGPGRVVIRLPRATRVTGVVRDETGRGVPGVLLLAAPAPWMTMKLASFSDAASVAWSGEDGSFSLEHLGEEEVNVRAFPPPSFAEPSPARAKPGESVEVRLRAAVSPWLILLHADGSPWSDLQVSSYETRVGDTHFVDTRLPAGSRGTTDALGRVHLRGLEAGKARRLSVSHRIGGPDGELLRRESWVPQNETITLPEK